MEAPLPERAAAASASLLVLLGLAGTAWGLWRPRNVPTSPGGTPAPPAVADERRLRVPHAPGSLVLDGDTDDPGWLRAPGPARTGPLLSVGGAVLPPYSEARLLWGDGQLYLALYAADEDIRARVEPHDGPVGRDDSFRLVFARDGVERAIEVSARGTMTDAIRSPGGPADYAWESGAHVAVDSDGTMNDPSDTDEEWQVEVAIPLRALGIAEEAGEATEFSVSRCDVPATRARTCAAWGQGQPRGVLVLE
jgi:hypothetical protein